LKAGGDSFREARGKLDLNAFFVVVIAVSCAVVPHFAAKASRCVEKGVGERGPTNVWQERYELFDSWVYFRFEHGMYACTRAHGENNLCTTGLKKIMEKGNVVESSIYDRVENNNKEHYKT